MFSLSPASPLEGLERDEEKIEYWKCIQAVASFSHSISSVIFMGNPDGATSPSTAPSAFQHILISYSELQHPSCSSAGGTGRAGSHLVPGW